MRFAIPVLALLAATSAPVAAQWSAQLDLGRSGTNVDRVEGMGLWSVSPALTWNGTRARLGLTGHYDGLGRGSQSASGLFTASWFLPAGPAWRVELTGDARGMSASGLRPAGAWQAGPRLHLLRPDAGAWVGLMAGSDPRGATLRWEAGLWRSFGRLALQLRGWQTAATDPGRADSTSLLPDTLAPVTTTPRFRTTTDLGAWARWSSARFELAGSTGVRLGLRQPASTLGTPDQGLGQNQAAGTTRTTTSTWWQAEATYWLNDHLGLAGVLGRSAAEEEFGVRSGSFVRLGVRASWQPHHPPAAKGAVRGTHGLRVVPLAGGEVEFAVQAPAVRRVEIMGDFSDWSPLALVQGGDGSWRVRVRTEPGLHRVSIRYDAGPWQAPAGLRVVADEFGGESGEVVIEAGRTTADY